MEKKNNSFWFMLFFIGAAIAWFLFHTKKTGPPVSDSELSGAGAAIQAQLPPVASLAPPVSLNYTIVNSGGSNTPDDPISVPSIVPLNIPSPQGETDLNPSPAAVAHSNATETHADCSCKSNPCDRWNAGALVSPATLMQTVTVQFLRKQQSYLESARKLVPNSYFGPVATKG